MIGPFVSCQLYKQNFQRLPFPSTKQIPLKKHKLGLSCGQKQILKEENKDAYCQIERSYFQNVLSKTKLGKEKFQLNDRIKDRFNVSKSQIENNLRTSKPLNIKSRCLLFSVETIIVTMLFAYLLLPTVGANPHAKRLYDHLLRKRGYSKVVRPVRNASEKVNVKIGLKLSQLIDLDERNQIMTTNVWVTQEWSDPALSWNPKDYGNVDMIYVPVQSIWIPDIVLYNTADGVYEMTSGTKAVLMYSGLVRWKPPASFRSSCQIDVTYFPFDEQQCSFQFGSWTYNIFEVDISHAWTENSPMDANHIEMGIDLSDFYRSAEWDLMAVPASKHNRSYAGSTEPFPEWTFNVTLKRKFLFYTVNLIVPLMSHAFITVLVFYIPAASTEKMSLSINILLSLTVFFLMLVEIIPPTSLVVPLLGKYLIFTLLLVSSSVMVTVVAYNVHFRSSATHRLPDWARKVFLYWLPRLLSMKRPQVENMQDVYLKRIHLCECCCLVRCNRRRPRGSRDQTGDRLASVRQQARSTFIRGKPNFDEVAINSARYDMSVQRLAREYNADQHNLARSDLSPPVQQAIQGALYISNYLKRQDEFSRTTEDWKYVALVIDRIFLWVYSIVCLAGSAIIICQAPMLYDGREPVVYG